MNRKNRKRGLSFALVLLVISLVLILLPDEIGLQTGLIIAMVCGGYVLRETLEPMRDE